MVPQFIIISFLFLLFLGISANEVYVGGLFPQFRRDSENKFVIDEAGVRRMAAAQLAINIVNNKSDGVYDKLLPDTQLKLLVGDSKRQAKHALDEVFHLAKRGCVGYIGPASSGPTTQVSTWLSIPSIDRAVISYSATSPQLSGPSFSNFLRTPPSDDVQSKMMATMMRDHFNWTCANVLIGLGDPYSTAGAQAFGLAARKKQMDVCTKVNFVSGSGDMEAAIKDIFDNKCCRVTVVFGQAQDLTSLFLEAHKQHYNGEWVVGESIMGSLDGIVKSLKRHLPEPAVHKLLRGTFTFGAKQFKSAQYLAFERDWYMQKSSANMSPKGIRTKCSDAVDATGRYIWRENGFKNGRCCGIDFQQAAQKRRADDCSGDDPICLTAAISTYVPFAYDAAIAMAHGLDKLFHHKGLKPDDITADLLSQAIQQSTFEGATGKVSFLSNGDRRVDDLEFTVYNYHATTRNFQAVGQMVGGGFVPCEGAHCPGIIFSDGTNQIPDSLAYKPVSGDTDRSSADSAYYWEFIAVVVIFIGCLTIALLAFFMFKWCEQRVKKAKEHTLRKHLTDRLEENWEEMIASEWVDGLSHMPEKWKSEGIVPVRSEDGKKLSNQLKHIGNRIEDISFHHFACGRHARLEALKTELNKFTKEQMAPFFAERDRMYKSCLLKGSIAEAATKSVEPSNTEPMSLQATRPKVTSDEEPIAKVSSVKATRKKPRSRSLIRTATHALTGVSYIESRVQQNAINEGNLPWPENTTPLFKQIMLLLRDLDLMFKASYEQRYENRVLNEEETAYAKWMENELPEKIPDLPDGFVITQNTSNLFDLYRQAGEIHSYYNTVFKRIAKETGAEWHPAPLKKLFRILEKAKHVQRGDSVSFNCSKILDVVRGTLVYDALGDEKGGVLRGVRALFDSKKLQIIRLKDRFANPTSAGWRDVLVNARMISSRHTIGQHVVEIQLQQKDLRIERTNVGGHYIYERWRILLEACQMACGDEACAKLQDLHDAYPSRSRSASMRQLSPSSSEFSALQKSPSRRTILKACDSFMYNAAHSRVHPSP